MVDYSTVKIGRPLHRTLRRVREAVLVAIQKTSNSPTPIITSSTHKIAKDRGTYQALEVYLIKSSHLELLGGLRGRGSDKAK